MNYESARDILGLPTVWNHDLLTKAYRKQAMRYHPDKNPSAEANLEFDLVKRAYDFLQENEVEPSLSTIFEEDSAGEQGWSINDLSVLTDKLQQLDNDKVSKLLSACKSVVSITRDLVGEFGAFARRRGKTVERVVMTNLEQMLTDQMFVFNFEGETYTIPLWYPHVYFELDDGSVLSVTVEAELPNDVQIDDDNNIVVRIRSCEASTQGPEQPKFDIKKFMNKEFLASPHGSAWASHASSLVYPKGTKIRIDGAGLLKIDDDEKKLNRTDRASVIIQFI